MKEMFIDKTIEIKARPEAVWKILTKREFTDRWAKGFDPTMHVESSWKMGDEVLWKTKKGETVVEGNVTDVKPGKLLRFTTFDVSMEKPKVGKDDGITFELHGKEGGTILHIRHGDFSVIPEGKKYYDMTEDSWKKILPDMKRMAEKNS